jgi:muramidase (phage lysozyme)
MCESGGNPTAENPSSSASGLWQFLASTWERTTGTPAPASAYSPDQQTAAAAQLWRSSGWGQWSCA